MATRAVELVAGGPRDLSVVAELMGRSFDARYGEAWTPAQCLGIMSLPGVWLTIAHLDDRAVGFALARSIADEAELLLLGVEPPARRRGVGAALLRSVIADARAREARALHLEVRAGNGAVALYQSAAFSKVGERRHYYRGKGGQQYDAHTYSLDLVIG